MLHITKIQNTRKNTKNDQEKNTRENIKNGQIKHKTCVIAVTRNLCAQILFLLRRDLNNLQSSQISIFPCVENLKERMVRL
jgi:hypothetical protein